MVITLLLIKMKVLTVPSRLTTYATSYVILLVSCIKWRSQIFQKLILHKKMTENSFCTANDGSDDHYVMKGPARYEYFSLTRS